jgi:hypothetical protein
MNRGDSEMRAIAIAVIAVVLVLGAWGAHTAIASVKASVAAHSVRHA